MAAADRAKLLASLELQDKFSKTADTAIKKLGGIEGAVKGLGVRSTAIGTALGHQIDRAIDFGIRQLTDAFTGGQRSLEQLEAVGLRTNAVIKSTGGVAGFTTDEIRKLSERLEDLSTNDDKAIQNTANLLLTFTSIGKGAFTPALQAVLDMNAAMGGGDEGLQTQAIRLGKALQDPVKGIDALKRVGVNFTVDQKKQISGLVKENKLFEAQQVILQELNKEFGGQAAAFGTGAAADARRAADAVEDFEVAFAEGLTPAVEAARAGLTTLFRDPAILQGIRDVGVGISSVLTPANIASGIQLLKDGFGTVKEVLPTLRDAAVVAGDVLKTAVQLFTSLPPDVQKIAIAALGINKLSGGAIGNVVGGLLELGLKGLKTITAANVTVVGANVTGGAPGVGGGTAPGAGGGGISPAVLIPIIGTTIAAAIAAGGFDTQRIQDLGLIGRTQEELRFKTENHFPDADIDKLAKRLAALQSGKFTEFISEQQATGQNVDEVNRTLDTRLQIDATLQRDANTILRASLTRQMPAPIVLNNIDVNISGRDLTSIEVQQKLIAGGFDMFEH